MNEEINTVKEWYESSYLDNGLKAQRRYPNEELLRFMGREFFDIPLKDRKDKHILEIGCGSCANLWMIAKEGFSTYGLDLSEEAINLGHKMLEEWGINGVDLKVGSMTKLPYKDKSLDAVVDILSAYCLDEENFEICMKEISRVLKPGGCFFSYTPGKNSDAFQNHKPSKLIDASTLNGIYRESSPYKGNHFPFRFIHFEEYTALMNKNGLEVTYSESISRSYYNRQEYFEFLVFQGSKL
jgi:ubiquinone/menaquinone biosynthesis C-methylase UbiE